jgi:dihydrolipoamide dehydrogenase
LPEPECCVGLNGPRHGPQRGRGLGQVVADAKTDKLLGVHMIGPDVTELVAEATLALELGATAEDLSLIMHAHSTLPEAVMEAAEMAHKQAIHIFQPK